MLLLSGEPTHTHFIVWFDPIVAEATMYRTQGENTNYYTTDAVQIVSIFRQLTIIQFLINVHFVLLQSDDLLFFQFLRIT